MHSFPEKYIISACALFGSILPTTEYESGKSGKGLSTDYTEPFHLGLVLGKVQFIPAC